MVTKDGISVDLGKVDVVENWRRPTIVTEIRSILRLVDYYRRFIEGFSKIGLPLTRLTQKGVKFEWSDECEHNFKELKDILVTAPILTIPSNSSRFVVYSDASHQGLGCRMVRLWLIVTPQIWGSRWQPINPWNSCGFRVTRYHTVVSHLSGSIFSQKSS